MTKPKINILGSVFSGEVESVGKDVIKFKVGDSAFGHTDMNFGAYAEYICLPEDGSLALKPTNISHKEAAAIPFGGVTALHFLKKAKIQPGQKVLIVGASGAVGTAAIQLAKSFGAVVTGVCSTANIDLVKRIGADEVIDYTKIDFTQTDELFDVIFDAVNTTSVNRTLKSLTKNGIMILSAAGMSEMLQALWFSKTRNKKIMTGVISHNAADIIFLRNVSKLANLSRLLIELTHWSTLSKRTLMLKRGTKKAMLQLMCRLTFRSRLYSVRKLFTGLAIAALIAWKLTVIMVMINAPSAAITNTHHDSEAR